MRARSPAQPLSIALLSCALVVLAGGCGTVAVKKKVFDGTGLEIKLKSKRKLLGRTVEQGYDHPVSISSARLERILGGIEIDTSAGKSAMIRERQSAINSALLPRISEHLAAAYEEAGPNQSILVKAVRKQRQKVVFDRKYLTSFTTWIESGQLYVIMSRVDWPVDEHKKEVRLPDPNPDERVMRFQIVTNAIYAGAGSQGVRVSWRGAAFGNELAAEEAREEAAPASDPTRDGGDEASAGDGAVDVSAGEAAAASASSGVAGAASTDVAAPKSSLDGLSSDALRQLADLEDARAAGRVSDAEYQRRRAEILGAGR